MGFDYMDQIRDAWRDARANKIDQCMLKVEGQIITITRTWPSHKIARYTMVCGEWSTAVDLWYKEAVSIALERLNVLLCARLHDEVPCPGPPFVILPPGVPVPSLPAPPWDATSES